IRRAVGIGVVLERSVKGGGDDEEPDRPEHRGDELDDQKVRPDHRGVLDALVHTDDGVLADEGEQPETLLLSRKRLGSSGSRHSVAPSVRGGWRQAILSSYPRNAGPLGSVRVSAGRLGSGTRRGLPARARRTPQRPRSSINITAVR